MFSPLSPEGGPETRVTGSLSPFTSLSRLPTLSVGDSDLPPGCGPGTPGSVSWTRHSPCLKGQGKTIVGSRGPRPLLGQPGHSFLRDLLGRKVFRGDD